MKKLIEVGEGDVEGKPRRPHGEPEGRFEASVMVTWEFEWWINDVYQRAFGSVDVTASFGVEVAEIQAVETGG